MSDRTLLVTGGDGFIGRRILSHFLDQNLRIVLLVQPKFQEKAARILGAWDRRPTTEAQLQLVPGDITESGLALEASEQEDLRETTTDIIHLAAAYDLALDEETGQAINVRGTENVLEFARGCKNLERLGYMSTTAISGDYEQIYHESDFDVNQNFNNYYEKTKFEAEGCVREAMDELPVVIFRPTTVVGDSDTGEIDKIDGPYYLIQSIDRNLHLVLPETGDSCFHVEPVDFVSEAFYTIFEKDEALGNCYHLADPDPPTYREFVDMVCEYWDKPKPFVTVPPGMMEPFFNLPGSEALFGLPKEAFTYSYLNRQYASDQAEELLKDEGIQCPPVTDYLGTILDFYRNHLAQGEYQDIRW
jgi:thioester reductase-like protein